MSAVGDIEAARLERWQRQVNGETVRNQARIIIDLEDCLRHLVYCIQHGAVINESDIERAKRLCE